MTDRICEGCGKQFVSVLLRDKVEDAALVLAIPTLLLYALYRLTTGWIGVVSAPMYVLLAWGAFTEIRKRDGRVSDSVAFGRKCPSCGEKTVDIESPRGTQALAYWNSDSGTVETGQTPPQSPELESHECSIDVIASESCEGDASRA